jgi:hypothetical protein
VSGGFKACAIDTAYFGRAQSWFDKAHIILNHGRPMPGAPAPQQGDLVGYEWGAKNVSHVGFNDLWGGISMCQTVETGRSKLSRDGNGAFKNWRLKSQWPTWWTGPATLNAKNESILTPAACPDQLRHRALLTRNRCQS